MTKTSDLDGRRHRALLPHDPPSLEVQGVQAAVLRQGRDHLRGLAARPGQVAPGRVADRQLQERHQRRTSSGALSASRRSRRGSCSTASGSRCRPARSRSSTATSKSTRPSSAARPATCTAQAQAEKITVTGGSRQDHRDRRTGAQRRERDKARGAVVPNRTRAALKGSVRDSVERWLDRLHRRACSPTPVSERDYDHDVIDHAEQYVDGQVHTNGIENFWSLLKRGLNGTYVSVEPFHLFRYLDERMFTFNNRDATDLRPLRRRSERDLWSPPYVRLEVTGMLNDERHGGGRRAEP